MFDTNRKGEKSVARNTKKILNEDADREILRSKIIKDLSWDALFDDFESIYV